MTHRFTATLKSFSMDLTISRAMKKILLLCVALVALCFVGCGVMKSTPANPKLPKEAVAYLERLGLKDDVTSYLYRNDMCWSRSLYAMGFDRPDKCWLVETSDSTMLCFSSPGEWVYTVVMSESGDLNTKYLSEVDNLNTVLVTCKNMVGKEMRLVGVSKEKAQWVIAAYNTYRIYLGPPKYYYFDNGDYKWCTIIN